MPRTVRIAPSILTADFGRLAEQAQAAEAGGADLWHLDVMDGHFVPAITFGADIVRAVHDASSLPIEVHLMVTNPASHAARFVEAGAERLIAHLEAIEGDAWLEATRAAGCEAALAVSPETPIERVYPHLARLAEVTVMLIHPGAGGQPMMPELLDKVRALRAHLDGTALETLVEVDGGVKAHNAASCAAAGVDLVVAGSATFNAQQTPAAALAELRAALDAR